MRSWLTPETPHLRGAHPRCSRHEHSRQRPHSPLLDRRTRRQRLPDTEHPLRHCFRSRAQRTPLHPHRRHGDRPQRPRGCGLAERHRHRPGLLQGARAESAVALWTSGHASFAPATERPALRRPPRAARQCSPSHESAVAPGLRHHAPAGEHRRLYRLLQQPSACLQRGLYVPRSGECLAAQLAAHAGRLSRAGQQHRGERHAHPPSHGPVQAFARCGA